MYPRHAGRFRLFSLAAATLIGLVLVASSALVSPATAAGVGKAGGVKAGSVTYSSFKVTWKKAKKAKGYRIQVSTSARFGAGTRTLAVRSKSRGVTVKGLVDGTRYYYRVRGISGAKAGAWSATRNQVLKHYKLRSGTTITSSSGDSDTLTFHWPAAQTLSRRAIGYRVVVAADRDMRGVVAQKTVWGTTQASFYLGARTPSQFGKTYFARVYTLHPSSAEGEWVDSTVAATRYSDGLQPTNPTTFEVATSCTGFTARWARGGRPYNAGGLVAEIATSAGGPLVASRAGYQPAEYVTVNDLRPNTDYWVRVRALNGRKVSAPTSMKKITTSGCAYAPELRVGSFNVTFDKLAHPIGEAWWQRKTAVADLVGKYFDVVGIQEANQNSLKPGEVDYTYPNQVPQIDDLTGLLQGRDASFRTVKSDGGVHVAYRSSMMTPVSGSKVTYQRNGYDVMVAQVFSLNASPRVKFIVASAHLESNGAGGSDAGRAAEVDAMIRKIHSLDPDAGSAAAALPIVFVGDFSTTMSEDKDTLVRASLSDSLADAEHFQPGRPLATLNSNNEWLHTPKNLVGVKVDGIYVSPRVSVSAWQVIAELFNGSFRGVIPADHHPLGSTIKLPST